MAKVRLNFQDFAEMLNACEDCFHFEMISGDIGEVRLQLFIDGNPSDYEMSIISGHASVAKEMTL